MHKSKDTEGARTVLIVEDETLIAMFLEDTLRDAGFEVIGPALHLDRALQLASEAHLDAAVLDVNLGADRRSLPVAAVLEQRRIPFLFLSGYGSSQETAAFAEVLTLQKPIEPDQLLEAVQRLVRASGPPSPKSKTNASIESWRSPM